MKPTSNTYSQPRVRVFRAWYEATMPLRERDGRKWLQFYDAVMGYALGSLNAPSFDDAELADLWRLTKVRPYTPGKIGYIKLGKIGGRNDERR